MHPPSEMMVDSFLPAMREAVARRLAEEGMSQGRIAGLLGVTQASVSLYLRSESRSSLLLRRLGVSEEDERLFASLLAEDLKKNPVYAVGTLHSIWTGLLGRGSLCGAHRALYPQLAQCDVCIRAYGGRGRTSYDSIERVAEAVRLVESSAAFVSVMPEVSVNIAYAPQGASSTEDVVAVPGRIVRVRGRARSFMRPEYGASTHVARVLLAVMAHDPGIRAAMNVRYDRRMGRALRRLNLNPLLLNESAVRTEAEMIHTLRDALEDAKASVASVVDLGAPGLEPSLYLFANGPVEVAKLGLRVAQAYAAQG